MKNVSWSIMFEVSPERVNNPEYMWDVLRKWDKVIPEAFAENAADDWYIWHGFLSRNTVEKAIPMIFEAFEEVVEVSVYKDITTGCFTDAKLRNVVKRS